MKIHLDGNVTDLGDPSIDISSVEEIYILIRTDKALVLRPVDGKLTLES